jgi:hypothetical protein
MNNLLKGRNMKLILCVIFLLVNVKDVNATTYYVATNGSDNNNCTAESTPCASLQGALWKRTAPGGDTIYIKNGIYYKTSGNFAQTEFGGTGESSRLIITNFPQHKPILDGSGAMGNGICLGCSLSNSTKKISFVTVSGLEIRNMKYAGVKYIHMDHLTIDRNHIHHNGTQGILGGGTRITINANHIYRNGRFEECATYPNGGGPTGHSVCNQDHGIYAAGTYTNITNNLIYSNLWSGIQVAGYPYVAGQTPSPDYGGARYWNVTNNTIALNNGPGIIVWQVDATNNTFANNLFYHTVSKIGYAINFYDCGGGHIVKNNLFSAPNNPNPISGYAGNYTQSGSINTPDAKLENPTLLDFRIKFDSPARNKGLPQDLNTLPTLSKDFVGVARPQDGVIDIGAYEFLSSTATKPAPPKNLRVN